MRSPLVALAALLAAVITVLGLDALIGSPDDDVGGDEVTRAADAGTWFCAVGDTGPDNSLRVVAGVPAGVTRTPEVRVDTFQEGAARLGPEVEVFPGSGLRQPIESGLQDVGIAMRWWRAPAALHRIWTVGTPGAPNGIVEGPCEPTPSRVWMIPGVSTAGGAEARLVLANPFETDATMTIVLTTPEGLREPQLLGNVVVPRGSVREVLLNEHAPEQPDLGAIVRVRTGRIIAEGYQTVDAAIGGIEGVTLVKAAPAASEIWTVPWFEDGGPDAGPAGTQSWLWVTNPTDRPASLTLTLHTTGGGVVPEIEELTVEPGVVRRIDLRGIVPEGLPDRAGATVRSENGVPIVVSSATQIGGPDAQRTGLGIQLGATAPDGLWIFGGAAGPSRADFLHLANPSSEPALVDVRIWTDLGAVVPPELQAVPVPAGSVVALDLGVHVPPEGGQHTTLVVAREGSVVAGRQAFDHLGTLQLVVTVGVPGRTWAGGRTVLPVEFAPGLTQRIGTVLGPDVPDTVLPTTQPEVPTDDRDPTPEPE
ncbi:MAG TPA: DUF5719 family protein [Nitriliruptorales bacterium]